MTFKRGYTQSENQKRKLSEWRRAHFKGEGNPMYGRKHTEETKRKIGKKSRGRDNKTSKPDFTERIDANGYVRIKFGKNNIYKHRWVMEQKLKRLLRPREVVHHIDENRLNNSPENLELLSDSQHIKLHWKNGNYKKSKLSL